MRASRPLFITATDTHVGKTVATFVMAVLLRQRGINAGVMKPVQCAGDDARFLQKALQLDDDTSVINPCYAAEPLSPHLALRRARKKFDLPRIRKNLDVLKQKYDVVLIEGAGGLMVPLRQGYYNADLIRDLNAEVIIVSRLGLGTINHTLLTVNQAKAYGLKIRGVLFSDTNPKPKSLPEKTNPVEIRRLSGVRILGTIPYLKTFDPKEVLIRCRRVILD